MTASDRWLAAAKDVLERVTTTQTQAIDEASTIFAESIAADHLVHVFGSGHSRMNTEEMFPRIGSYPGFHPIAATARAPPTPSTSSCSSRWTRSPL